MVPNSGEPEEISSGDPQEGSTPGDTSGQTLDVPAPFVMVENPCSSVISLSSNDSLHQTAPLLKSEGNISPTLQLHCIKPTCRVTMSLKI